MEPARPLPDLFVAQDDPEYAIKRNDGLAEPRQVERSVKANRALSVLVSPRPGYNIHLVPDGARNVRDPGGPFEDRLNGAADARLDHSSRQVEELRVVDREAGAAIGIWHDAVEIETVGREADDSAAGRVHEIHVETLHLDPVDHSKLALSGALEDDGEALADSVAYLGVGRGLPVDGPRQRTAHEQNQYQYRMPCSEVVSPFATAL